MHERSLMLRAKASSGLEAKRFAHRVTANKPGKYAPYGHGEQSGKSAGRLNDLFTFPPSGICSS
jgi:hypothetical protein